MAKAECMTGGQTITVRKGMWAAATLAKGEKVGHGHDKRFDHLGNPQHYFTVDSKASGKLVKIDCNDLVSGSIIWIIDDSSQNGGAYACWAMKVI